MLAVPVGLSALALGVTVYLRRRWIRRVLGRAPPHKTVSAVYESRRSGAGDVVPAHYSAPASLDGCNRDSPKGGGPTFETAVIHAPGHGPHIPPAPSSSPQPVYQFAPVAAHSSRIGHDPAAAQRAQALYQALRSAQPSQPFRYRILSNSHAAQPSHPQSDHPTSNTTPEPSRPRGPRHTR